MLVDRVEVASHDYGTLKNGERRARLTGRYLAKKTGSVTVRIEFVRMTGALFVLRHSIDNVWLEESDGPQVFFEGQSMAGSQTFKLKLVGEPQAQAALFVSVGKLPGVRIPGFSGFWDLRSPVVPIFLGLLDASGAAVIKLPLATQWYRLRGELQGIHASASKGVRLGIRYPIVAY